MATHSSSLVYRHHRQLDPGHQPKCRETRPAEKPLECLSHDAVCIQVYDRYTCMIATIEMSSSLPLTRKVTTSISMIATHEQPFEDPKVPTVACCDKYTDIHFPIPLKNGCEQHLCMYSTLCLLCNASCTIVISESFFSLL